MLCTSFDCSTKIIVDLLVFLYCLLVKIMYYTYCTIRIWIQAGTEEGGTGSGQGPLKRHTHTQKKVKTNFYG
jgi:hypothetical protein